MNAINSLEARPSQAEPQVREQTLGRHLDCEPVKLGGPS